MFEPFSSGYYLGRLYVEPHGGEHPAMHREQHEYVSEQLYADGGGEREGTEGATTAPASEGPSDDGTSPVVHRAADGPPTVRDGSEPPLVMKIGGAHVPVRGAEGVPERTVALPADWLEATRLKNPPTLTEVLLAKREHAERLLTVAEDLPAAGV
jgi:hypothetical protein